MMVFSDWEERKRSRKYKPFTKLNFSKTGINADQQKQISLEEERAKLRKAKDNQNPFLL